MTSRYMAREVRRNGQVVEAFIKKGLIGIEGITDGRNYGKSHDGHVHWKLRERNTGLPGFRNDVYDTAAALGLKGTSWGATPIDSGRKTLDSDPKDRRKP